MKARNIAEPIQMTSPYPVDVKKTVGTNMVYTSIDDLLTNLPDSAKYNMIVEDVDNNVVWKVYKNEADEWVKRLHDGTFYVRLVETTGKNPNQAGAPVTAIDGENLRPDDIVLFATAYGPLNGIYLYDGSEFSRHVIFDESVETLTGVTIVVVEGNNYKNSQWKFTTIGDIVPNGDLSTTIQDWVNNSALFETYTWLTFELLGGQYARSQFWPVSSGYFDFDILLDTSLNPIETTKQPIAYIPYKEYTWVKTHQHNLAVVTPLNGFDYEKIVLTSKGDWIKAKLINNPPVDKDDWYIITNRVQRYNEYVLSSDSLLITVPGGYSIYSITGYVSTSGGTQNFAYLKFGTTAGSNDIATEKEYLSDGTPLKFTTKTGGVPLINQLYTTVYVSGITDGPFLGWDSNTVTFKIHMVKTY